MGVGLGGVLSRLREKGLLQDNCDYSGRYKDKKPEAGVNCKKDKDGIVLEYRD